MSLKKKRKQTYTRKTYRVLSKEVYERLQRIAKLSQAHHPALSMRREVHVHETKTSEHHWNFRLVSVCLKPDIWAGSSWGSTFNMGVRKWGKWGKGFPGYAVQMRSNREVSTHATFEEAREVAIRLVTSAYERALQEAPSQIVWFWFRCGAGCSLCPPEVQARVGNAPTSKWQGAGKVFRRAG